VPNSTTGLELLVAQAWVYSRLVTDQGVIDAFAARQHPVEQRPMVPDEQVWEYRAPEAVFPPFITYRREGPGIDVTAVGGHRIYTRIPYLITVTGVGEDWSQDDIYARIEGLFGLAVNIPVPDPEGFIEACVRREVFDQYVDFNGVHYRHLGGIYEIAVQAAAAA
jgi:hypothetical protein